MSNIPVIEFAEQKAIWLGDAHFGARNDSSLFHDRFELFYNHLFAYMLDNGIKLIVQFGDLFDRRKYVNFNTLKRSREYFFDKLKEYGFELVVFLGNHDVAYKNTLEVNSPSLLLKDYDNIHIIVEPTELVIGNRKLLMLPWICADNYNRTMECIEQTTAQYLLGHLELNGFEMYKGATCDHGFSPDLFAKFAEVWTGHFHHVSKKGNITYIGSPCQIMWSDFGDERGFFVFDPKTCKADFVKNPFDMFFKLSYDDRIITMSDVLEWDFSKYAKTFVKVVIVEKNDLYLFDKFIEALEQAGAIVTTVEDHKYKNIETDEEIFEGVDSVEDILKKFSQQYSEAVDADRLYKYLMDLYYEAVSLETV